MIKEGVEIVTSLFDRYSKWKELEVDIEAKTRLLYLECKKNLALLDCIAEKNGKHAQQEESSLLSLASLIETDILELIFMEGKANNKFLEVISAKVVLELTAENKFSGEEKIVSGKKRKNVIQWAMFIYIRVSVLKKLAASKDGCNMLKNIQYRNRLKNIQTAYLGIVKSLSNNVSVKILQL